MEFLTGAFLIVSIVFMCVFMFIGIWSFVVYLKSYRQKRYQNYILEKISQKLSLISDNIDNSDKDSKYAYLTGDEDFEFSDNEIDNLDNITNNINKRYYHNSGNTFYLYIHYLFLTSCSTSLLTIPGLA